MGNQDTVPTNINSFVTAATDPVNGRSVVGTDALLYFNVGGSIRLRIPGMGKDTTYANAAAFSANRAFVVNGANLYVKGTLVGDLAIGAISSPLTGGGNVYVTGDIRYKTDPRVTPSSTDKLGIYATNDVTVTYDPINPAYYYNRKVDGSVFSLTGEFNVEDHKNHPVRGTLTTYGAMMQYYRGAVDVVNPGSGTLKSGYYKGYQYDERLAKNPPKYFPATGRYTLYAWREN